MARYRIFSEPAILKENGPLSSATITSNFNDIESVVKSIQDNQGWFVIENHAFKPIYIEKVDD